MSFFNGFTDPTIGRLRSGTAGDEYVSYNEAKNIINGTIILTELPDQITKLKISDGSGNWVEITSGTPTQGQFFTNYVSGVVTLNPADNGKVVNCQYMGRGAVFFPGSRIWLQTTNGNIDQTLSDKLSSLDATDSTEQQARIATDSSLQTQITQEATDRTAADTAHANSTTAHDAANIIYNGKVTGATNVKGAADKLNDRIDNIVNYSGSSNQEIVDARPSVNGTANATLKARLDTMEQKQVAAAIASAALKHGWNYLLTNDASPLSLTVSGKTLVNILGKDGGCESLTGWGTAGTAPTLSTTQVKQGTNAIKVSLSGTSGYAAKDYSYTLDTTKQYIFAGWVYIESYTTGVLYLRLNDVGSTANVRYNPIIDTTKVGTWQFVFGKVPTANTLVGNGFNLLFGATSAATCVAYFDSIRLYELDLNTYNAIGTTYTATTTPSIDDILPYVDSVQHLRGVSITKPGKNLFPPFTEQNNTQITVISPYFASCSTVGTYTVADGVKLVPGQQYTFSVNIDNTAGVGSTVRMRVDRYDANGNLLSNGNTNYINAGASGICTETFTAESNLSYVQVKMQIPSGFSGTAKFTNPQLELGSTATAFEAANPDYIYSLTDASGNPLKLASNVDGSVKDSLYARNGQWYKEKRWSLDNVLDGSLAWAFYSDAIGYKTAKLTSIPYTAVADSQKLVKFDGKIITLNNTQSAIDTCQLSSSALFITISDTDTGFDNAYIPANGEINPWFYGWKVSGYTAGTAVTNEATPQVAANGTYTLAHAGKYKSVTVTKSVDNVTFTAATEGTDYTVNWSGTAVLTNNTAGALYYQISYTYGVTPNSWASVVDGSAPSTNALAYVSANMAPNYTPYKLSYQLSVTQEEAVIVEGSIDTNAGGNQIEIAEGVIVREVATPGAGVSNGLYGINIKNSGSYTDSPLKNRAAKLIAIYKNGVVDTSKWTFYPPGSNGWYATIKATDYDPASVYTVTYKVYDNDRGGMTANCTDVTATYNSTEKDILDTLNKANADNATNITVLQETKANRNQSPWIAPTMQNAWVNYGGTDAVAGYMKDEFGFVSIKGRVKSGTIGQTVFTLPAGYRPKEANRFVVSSNGAYGEAIVNPDGTVVANVGSNVSFNLTIPRIRAEQ